MNETNFIAYEVVSTVAWC